MSSVGNIQTVSTTTFFLYFKVNYSPHTPLQTHAHTHTTQPAGRNDQMKLLSGSCVISAVSGVHVPRKLIVRASGFINTRTRKVRYGDRLLLRRLFTSSKRRKQLAAGSVHLGLSAMTKWIRGHHRDAQMQMLVTEN